MPAICVAHDRHRHRPGFLADDHHPRIRIVLAQRHRFLGGVEHPPAILALLCGIGIFQFLAEFIAENSPERIGIVACRRIQKRLCRFFRRRETLRLCRDCRRRQEPQDRSQRAMDQHGADSGKACEFSNLHDLASP
jgi:hypothetical protein